MSFRIAVNLLWLIVISVEELSIDDGCMLWDITENKLIFTCRTSDFSNPLSLIDNRGKEYARCRFEQIGNQIFRCTGRHETRIVSVDVPKKEVRFTIYKIESKDVDGIWTCAQGNRQFTNNVSKFNGIIDDTDIYMDAKIYQINNTKRVSLQCSACRKSRGNTVEFLINHTSEVSITYNSVTGNCTDRNGECSPDICSCLLNGNKFNATFPFNSKGYTIYSCDMQFKEKGTSMIFSKTAHLRSNGNDFEPMSTNTTINKKAQVRQKDRVRERILSTGDTLNNDLETENVTIKHHVVPDETLNKNAGSVTKLVLIVILSVITAVLVFIIVTYVFYQRKTKKYLETENVTVTHHVVSDENAVSDPGETTSLLQAVGISYSAEKVSSSTTMKTDAGYYEGPAELISAVTAMTNEAGGYIGPVLFTDAETSTEKGCQSEETMTDESYLDTVKEDRNMENNINSGATKRCHPCSMLNKLMEALYWCLDCGIDLCINCKDIHQVISKHTITKKEKLPTSYSLSFCCPQHQQQGLDYFCIDHDKLCCLECRSINHTKCIKIDHIDVLSKACRTSQAFRDYEDQLDFSSGVLTNVIFMLTRNIDSIEKDCNRIEELISITKENESVEKERHARELTNAKSSCLNTLDKNISEAKSMEAVTDEQKRLFDFFEKIGSNKLLFLLIHSSKQHLLELSTKIHKLSDNIKRRSVHFIGYEEENCAAGHIKEFERQHGMFQDKNQTGTNVQNPIGPVVVSFEDESLIKNTKINSSMTLSKNGFLLLCSTYHLVVLVLAGKNHEEEPIELTYTPKDISVIPDMDIAVLTSQRNDAIQFVDIHERKVASIKQVEGSANGSITCSAEYIFVGVKMEIMILDHEGKPISRIEIDGVLRNLSYFNERMYFSECGSNRIRCIQMNGDTVFCHQSKNIAAPISVILNKEGHAYVLDRGPIKLHKLSVYGHDIGLEIKGTVDLQSPRSMCFNKDYTKLYVLNRGGSSICTFKIEK